MAKEEAKARGRPRQSVSPRGSPSKNAAKSPAKAKGGKGSAAKKQNKASKSKTPVKSTGKSVNKKEENKRRSTSKKSASIKKLKEDIKNLSKSKDKKRKRAKKDKALPKGASGPYIQYTSEQIPILKAMPKYKAKLESKELKHTDFMAMAAEAWGKLTDKEKEKYNLLAEKDK